MLDIGLEAKFSFDNSKQCFGTFLGFEHDAYKSTYESLTDENKKPSRLDHIWSSPLLETKDPIIWVENEKQLIERKTPSDHLPLLCTINLKNKE
ncbi:Hypothetical protein KVN_LOCUS2 [uncultured virus]|nr:Hypothetical protein KVN_LOCUS2 [uncultured virus]